MPSRDGYRPRASELLVAGRGSSYSVSWKQYRAPFPALVLLLVQAALGDEAAFALRVAYGEEGVEVGAL